MERLQKTIASIGPLDEEAMRQARARQDSLTKPQGSLGRLEELSIQIAGIQGRALPVVKKKAIITMVGDHGVTAEAVSAYPQEVTPQMVYNFLRGGAAINVLSRHVGARVVVVDVGVAADLESHPELVSAKVAKGTRSMLREPAMTSREAIDAIKVGISVVEKELAKGLDIVGTGDMGIGNTTPSSAIIAAITGAAVATVTGRGTGLSSSQLQHKVAVIESVLQARRPNVGDPLDVLAKVGGLEIAGIVGIVLGGAAYRVPVVVDGFISTAGALIATEMAPAAKPYIIPAHRSVEIGHAVALEHMGLRPLLDLDLRLGEGTGAALGISLAEASVKILREMATFGEAGVAGAVEEGA